MRIRLTSPFSSSPIHEVSGGMCNQQDHMKAVDVFSACEPLTSRIMSSVQTGEGEGSYTLATVVTVYWDDCMGTDR